MNPEISIIVPVYKVEKYLNRCVDSILAQTFTDFELILIDDGSPDACGKICDEYAEKDHRVVVIHKENGGVSAARNAGLNSAKGDYIGFVDSDDYISPYMFETLYRQMVIADADMAMCHFQYTYGKDNLFENESAVNDAEIFKYNKEQTFEKIMDYSLPLQISVWNKLFKRELVEGICFDTEKAVAEDFEFLMKTVVRCNTAVYIPYAFYGYYYDREGSAMFTDNQDFAWYYRQKDNISSVMDFVAETEPVLKNHAIACKCVNGDLSFANWMATSGNYDKKVMKELRNDLKTNLPVILKSKLHVMKKIQIVMLILSFNLYRCVMKRKLKNT